VSIGEAGAEPFWPWAGPAEAAAGRASTGGAGVWPAEPLWPWVGPAEATADRASTGGADTGPAEPF
jgi:hypothetical protein